MLIGGRAGWRAGWRRAARQRRVYELCAAGKWDEAWPCNGRCGGWNQAFAKYNLAACIKGGLEAQGYAVGNLPPQKALGAEGAGEVAAILEAVEGPSPKSLAALRPYG